MQDELLAAIRAGQLGECRRLLDAGADVNAGNDVWESPLLAAATLGDLEVTRLLLDRGADMARRSLRRNVPPLIVAAVYENFDVCKLLLERGAPVDDADSSGFTALHKAAKRARLDIVEILVANGAQGDVASHSGGTVLHAAVASGDVDTCRAIMGLGISPETVVAQPPPNYLTPLQHAISEDAVKVVMYFVEECGCEWRSPAADGRSVWDVAWNAPKVKQYLRSLEAVRSVESALDDGALEVEQGMSVPKGFSPL